MVFLARSHLSYAIGRAGQRNAGALRVDLVSQMSERRHVRQFRDVEDMLRDTAGIGDHYGKQRINGHWHDFDMPQCRLRQ